MPSQLIANATIADVEAALINQYGRVNISEKKRSNVAALWTFIITSKSFGKCRATSTPNGVEVSMSPHVPALLVAFTLLSYLLFIIPGVFLTIYVIIMYFVTRAVISVRFSKMAQAVQSVVAMRGGSQVESVVKQSVLTNSVMDMPDAGSGADEISSTAEPSISTPEKSADQTSLSTQEVSHSIQAGWSRRLGLIGGAVLLVTLLLLALGFAQSRKAMLQTNMLSASSKCRSVLLALQNYALDHGGEYPDGTNANEALRVLFKQGYISDERDFSCPNSFGKADNSIGISPNYAHALTEGENHWAMTKGVNGQSLASIPLIFENPVSASWPPTWSVADANKPVPGRAWQVDWDGHHMKGSSEEEWNGYGVFVGRKDGSVSMVPLGKAEGGAATVAPDASGKNIFELAGHHEILDVARPMTPVASSVAPPPSEPPASTKPVKGEVYISAREPADKITLISGSECEMQSREGGFLGTYTLEGDMLRFVFSVLGTQRVSYAKVYSDGIVMTTEGIHDKGEVLLNALGRKQKEERDRAAELERKRINAEAPKTLIGVWKLEADPPDGRELEGVMFRADKIWAEIDWKANTATEKGHWGIENCELQKGLFNVGTFDEGQIVELSQDRFVLFKKFSRSKIIATRVIERSKEQKDEANSKMNEPSSPKNPSAGTGGGETEQQRLSRLIVGSWSRYSGRVFYFEDGRYMTAPNSGSGEMGQWQIKDGTLIQTARSRQMKSIKIANLDARELALDFGDGPKIYYSRDEEAGNSMASDGTQAKADLGAPSATLAEVKAFITVHHDKASRGDTAGLAADYAQTVVFLDKGLLSPVQIQEEEVKDREQWPKGGERIVGELIVANVNSNWLATYTMEFYRENAAGSWMSGTADMKLTIMQEGARLLITSQSAKVRDVRKGKTR